MFKTRATKPERIDVGDYTQAEYERFLKEIRFINERLGDRSALEATLLHDIESRDLNAFSVIDVGAGSGALLGVIADFARCSGRAAMLVGLDLNELSVDEIAAEAKSHREIMPVRGDALHLPFADGTYDYAICSLFTHHLTDDQVALVFREMSRVARRGILVIDLERNAKAWLLYKLFCVAYRISPLVRHDGSLSIRKGFTSDEMRAFGEAAGLKNISAEERSPFRVVLRTF